MKEENKYLMRVFAAVAVMLIIYCVDVAAKNTGSYWSSFDSSDGRNEDESSAYMVVDASPKENGIGPFKGEGAPSFEDSAVTLYEEGFGEADQKKEAEVHWKEITVQAGETLSVIAEKHGIPLKSIVQANELKDRHKLIEGQTLLIPDKEEYTLNTLAYVRQLKKDEIAKKKQAVPFELTEYVVKDGDTLWSIANAFNLDVNSIFGCNKINDAETLKVGKTLRVPNQDGILVTVRANQTIDKLAAEYSIYKEAIIAANNLRDDAALTKGSRIFLPGVKVVAFIETAKGKSAVSERTREENKLAWPTVGRMTSQFGWRSDPIRGGRDFHTGLDIAAPHGRSIVAAASGRVVYAGWMSGYGKTLVISHSGGMTTMYAHCSKLLASQGKSVKRGEKIALMGSTGRSTGCHLHFEVRRGGTPVNPIKLLK